MMRGWRLLLLLGLMVAGPVRAQVPPPVDLGIQNIPQETQVWCWAAVAQQIVLRLRGPAATPPQCAMVAIANGAHPNVCCGQQHPGCFTTGSLQQIQGLIAHFGGAYSQIAPPADPVTLYQTLASGRAVILAVSTSPYAGHVIVLRGMRWDPVYGAILLVNDPMAMFSQEVPFQQIVGVWGAAIVVS